MTDLGPARALLSRLQELEPSAPYPDPTALDAIHRALDQARAEERERIIKIADNMRGGYPGASKRFIASILAGAK